MVRSRYKDEMVMTEDVEIVTGKIATERWV